MYVGNHLLHNLNFLVLGDSWVEFPCCLWWLTMIGTLVRDSIWWPTTYLHFRLWRTGLPDKDGFQPMSLLGSWNVSQWWERVFCIFTEQWHDGHLQPLNIMPCCPEVTVSGDKKLSLPSCLFSNGFGIAALTIVNQHLPRSWFLK